MKHIEEFSFKFNSRKALAITAFIVGMVLIVLNQIPTEVWAHPDPSEPISIQEHLAFNKEHGLPPPSFKRTPITEIRYQDLRVPVIRKESLLEAQDKKEAAIAEFRNSP